MVPSISWTGSMAKMTILAGRVVTTKHVGDARPRRTEQRHTHHGRTDEIKSFYSLLSVNARLAGTRLTSRHRPGGRPRHGRRALSSSEIEAVKPPQVASLHCDYRGGGRGGEAHDGAPKTGWPFSRPR
jgi:hypothetical protein